MFENVHGDYFQSFGMKFDLIYFLFNVASEESYCIIALHLTLATYEKRDTRQIHFCYLTKHYPNLRASKSVLRRNLLSSESFIDCFRGFKIVKRWIGSVPTPVTPFPLQLALSSVLTQSKMTKYSY